jgi:hypothetical protein
LRKLNGHSLKEYSNKERQEMSVNETYKATTITAKQKSPWNRSGSPEINAYLNTIKMALVISRKE